MGKRKSDKLGQGIGALLVLVLLAAAMAAVALPLYLLVRMAAHWFQSWKLQRRLRIRETGCWLDEGGKQQFKREFQAELARMGANQNEEARLRKLIEMEHEKARQFGISYNNDGLPRRTSEGVAIRDNIDHLESQLRQVDLSIRQLTCRQPYETWDELNEVMVQQSKVKAAFLGWLVGAAFFYAAKQEGAPLNIWIALFVPASISGVCYFMASCISKNPATTRCPRPAYITLKNVDIPEMDLPLRRRVGLRLVGVVAWGGLIAFAGVKGHRYGSAEAIAYREQVNQEAAVTAAGEKRIQDSLAAGRTPIDPVEQLAVRNVSPDLEAEESSSAPTVLKALAVDESLLVRQGRLIAEEIEGWDVAKVRYEINTIYVRHGVVFPNKDLQAWASQQSWYKPVPGLTLDNAEELFSVVERHDIEMLATRRDRLLGKVETQRALPVSEPLNPQRVATWDAMRVRTEINSVYARYGVEFPNRELQAWADKQPEYKRVTGRTFDDADSLMDANDRSNIEI